jgi:hypothetical protein
VELCEAGEVALVLVHVLAELCPEGAGFVVRERGAINKDSEAR